MSQLSHQSPGLVAPIEQLAGYSECLEAVKTEMKRKGSTRKEISDSINLAKSSFVASHKVSSASTIFALTNSMVGSVCLVIPILIQRTLGKKYTVLFNFSSSLLMFLVGNIYFLLINQTMYPLFCFIFSKTGVADSFYVSQFDMNSSIVFDKFSIQIFGLIAIVALAPMFFIKNITSIIKLAHGGFFAIGMYVCFVIYTFFDNLIAGRISANLGEVNYFSTDIAGIAGSFALAFMVHNAIAQIMSSNEKAENNNRDMSIGYMVAAGIYGIIGIFGSYGIVGRSHSDTAYTITQYFDSDSIAPFIINLFFAGHLVTAFPLFCFVSKTQFLNLIYPTSVAPKLAYFGFNLVFATSCTLINMLNLNPGIVIGITGAVVGFVIVYFLPILIHLTCITKLSGNNQEDEDGESKIQTQYQCDEQKQLQNRLINSDNIQSNISTPSNVLNNNNSRTCGPHNQLKNRHIYVRFGFYLMISAVGIYLAVIQLIQIFQS